MKNVFSAEERTPEHESFASQEQRGEQPTAPGITSMPSNPHRPLAPFFEDLARRSAPASALSLDLTYQWRR